MARLEDERVEDERVEDERVERRERERERERREGVMIRGGGYEGRKGKSIEECKG